MDLKKRYELEENINAEYAEIAECSGVELSGHFILLSDGRVEWVSVG